MKRPNLIFVVIVFIFSIPIIFYLWFGIGMISNSGPKSINTDWVKQYKTTMKADFININTTKVYYQFGRVHFDFTGAIAFGIMLSITTFRFISKLLSSRI